MSEKPSTHSELLLLCGKVRDEALTEADARRLDALLQGSDEAKALYVRYMSVVSILESRGMAAANESIGDTSDEDVFAELLALEQAAEAELAEKPKLLHLHAKDQRKPVHVGGAALWLIARPAVWGSIAALFVVSLVLVGLYSFWPDEKPVAVGPGDASPVHVQPVATLTDQRDARWADGRRALGDRLIPGQRLTLTTGFAEITTDRGAVAMLQAPATIELIDNNTLRLVAGRLVGICETDSSKGLVVHTPQMDVTDLGTRFGVDAIRADATELHVIKGEVAAVRSGTSGKAPSASLTLAAGQSVRAEVGNTALTRIEFDTQYLTALLPSVTPLPGTGQGIQVGQVDPNWQIVEIEGQVLETPQAVRVDNNPRYTDRVANDPASAQWLSWDPKTSPQIDGFISYTFRTLVTLEPDVAALQVHYCADNRLVGIRVNGDMLPIDDEPEFTEWQTRSVTIDQHLMEGSNVIEFIVANHRSQQWTAGGVGLHVRWEVVGREDWKK